MLVNAGKGKGKGRIESREYNINVLIKNGEESEEGIINATVIIQP